MMGMLLAAGFAAKIKNTLFNFSLLALLFFMGVSLGKDRDILSKIADFGIISGIMSISVVIFSIIGVLIITKLFKKAER